jgi:hypothetical protein
MLKVELCEAVKRLHQPIEEEEETAINKMMRWNFVITHI